MKSDCCGGNYLDRNTRHVGNELELGRRGEDEKGDAIFKLMKGDIGMRVRGVGLAACLMIIYEV